MSQLATARRQVSSIRTLIRQQKYMPAVQALYDAVVAIIKNPLIKSERDEFEQLIEGAIYHITSDPVIRKSAALDLKYVPGKERELLEPLRMLLEVFQESFSQEAEQMLREANERRERQLNEGQAYLDGEEYDNARAVFRAVANEYEGDGELRVDIGERFLRAKQYEDAVEYLEEGIGLAPEMAHAYNSLAMAHRKMGKYSDAEQCYLKATEQGYRDPHLFFNMGRLYIDWEDWKKAIHAANEALSMDPNFAEAQKLLHYAEKKFQEN